MPARRTWTDEDMKNAVAESNSVLQVVKKLGLRVSGGNYATVYANAERMGLDTSHFKGKGWSKGNAKTGAGVLSDLTPLFYSHKKISKLRERLVAAGLKLPKCEECGIDEWRGKPAPLQIDHIDGDRRNNQLNNLRVLCANCHALTDTWGFKNARRRPE